MTLVVELLPISAVLSLLIQQVLETALAAHHVLIEKDIFKILAKYLQDVQPVLSEMQRRDLQDSQAARQALDSLQEDIRKAKNLIQKCNTKPRFYLLVNCRRIVKEAQATTRDIGKSLQLLAVANAEIAGDIKSNVERLQNEMMSAKFQTSASGQRVLDKLDIGLQEHKTDQGFANDLIREIAMAVGVAVNDDSEISKELASFKREKEEAAERKEREEEAFMEQVIALLERSDAAKFPEVARSRYEDRKQAMGSSLREFDDAIPALQSFICPLKQDVMEDPVTVATGQTYDREQIQRWFDTGHTKDPVSNQELPNTLLRPNGPLKKSIEEWRERNYCQSIRKARKALQAGVESQLSALQSLHRLCIDDSRTRDWIVSEGLMSDVVDSMKSSNKDVKKTCLSTLSALIQDHDENKDNLVEAGGVEVIVPLLAGDNSLSKQAVNLLLELLQHKDGVNRKVHTRIGQEKSAILLLVTRLSTNDNETVQAAKEILLKLSDKDEYVIQMAQANWYNPLVDHLRKGSDETKLSMVKALTQMPLPDESMRTLGQEGIVSILTEMLSSNKAEREVLGALRNLSRCAEIKAEIANSNVLPAILEYLFSESSTHMMELAAEILSELFSMDGPKFFVDAGIDPGPAIEKLLDIQRRSLPVTRIHVLHALLGLVSSPTERELVRGRRGIPELLPLLDHKDRQVQDCAVQLIDKLSESEEGSKELLELIVETKMYGSLVRFLQGRDTSDSQSSQAVVQVAAAGILARLPAENDLLATALEAAGALPALLALLHNASQKFRENAVGALLLFVQPSNLDMQRKVANLDMIPILVESLTSGTSLTKARAAQVLGKLSTSTVQLSVQPESRSWLWSCFKGPQQEVCAVHQGSCDVKTTFCLVAAGAVGGLVSLLKERGNEAEAALDALSTLVQEDRIVEKGVKLLDESGAINPVVELLVHGTLESKSTAIDLLGRIFTSSKMQEKFAQRAQTPLAALAGDAAYNIRRKAANVLGKLNVIQAQSSYF